MKKIMLGLILVASFAACKPKKSELVNNNPVLVQDTFRMYNNSVLTDKGANEQLYNARPVHNNTANRSSTRSSNPVNHTGTASSATGNTGTNKQATAPAKKKGWSKAAKGAAIGAGTGAVAGAIINGRNRGAGAAIGAAVGAAGGFIIGRTQDKKDGRY